MTSEIPESEIREHEIRLMDKYLESINVYWSALLTINGLMLTFFSIDVISSAKKSQSLSYVLVISCAVSLWLLLWNFRTIKRNYYKLGRMTANDMPDVPKEAQQTAQTKEEMSRLIDKYTAEWRHGNLEKAARQQRYMMIREYVVEVLMVLETILILAILLIEN